MQQMQQQRWMQMQMQMQQSPALEAGGAGAGGDSAYFEYRGKDGNVHGPYGASQMRGWAQQASNLPPRAHLGASSLFLVGENPTYPVSALQGCEGLWSIDYGHV